jgi:polysaccharide export outer membrane protein
MRPDLTGQVTVGSDGTIELPMLGKVQAEGRTPEELARDLTQRYRRVDPGIAEVLVQVREYNSRSVTVVGEIHSPGRYPFRSIPGLWEVLLQAGGATPTADLERVQIVRKDSLSQEPVILTVNVSSMLDGEVPADLPDLQPRDTIVVPTRDVTLASAAGASFQVLGSVRNPGVYRLSAAETLAEALAISGGPLPEANLKKIHLTRSGTEGLVAYELNLESVLYEGKPISNFKLEDGDTVTIPSKTFGPGTVARGLVLFLPLITSLTSLIVVLDR